MLTNQKMNIGKQLKKEGPISILHYQKKCNLSYKQSIKFLVNAQKLHDKVLHERGCQGPIHYCHNRLFILKLNQNENIFFRKEKL